MSEDTTKRPDETSNPSSETNEENESTSSITANNEEVSASTEPVIESQPEPISAPQPATEPSTPYGERPRLPAYLERRPATEVPVEPQPLTQPTEEPKAKPEAIPLPELPEPVKLETSFPYLKRDAGEQKPVTEKTEPAPIKEVLKPVGKPTFPPGFEFERKSSVGVVEGHPLEGFTPPPPRPARPEPELEPVPAAAEIETEPESETEEEEATETLFPVEGEPAERQPSARKPRRSRKNTAEKPESAEQLTDSAAIAEATFAPETSTEPVVPAPIVPRVEFRSDRNLEEPVKREPREQREPREPREPRVPSRQPISRTAESRSESSSETERPAPPPRQRPEPRPQTQPQQRRDVPAPSQPLNRPESSKYMGGGTRGPVSAGTSEGAIRGRLGGADKPAQVERPQREDRNETSRPDNRPDNRNQPRRPGESSRPAPSRDTRQQAPSYRRSSEEDENSLEAMKRKIGELTNTDRKVLNYLVTKKKITRNLNEQIEKDTLLSEKIVEVLGSWTVVIIMVVLWIGALGYMAFTPREAASEGKVLFVFGSFMVLWASLVLISFKARISRERSRAANDYEIQLKTELDLRALRDRVEGDIAPRIPEILSILKRLEARMNK